MHIHACGYDGVCMCVSAVACAFPPRAYENEQSQSFPTKPSKPCQWQCLSGGSYSMNVTYLPTYYTTSSKQRDEVPCLESLTQLLSTSVNELTMYTTQGCLWSQEIQKACTGMCVVSVIIVPYVPCAYYTVLHVLGAYYFTVCACCTV